MSTLQRPPRNTGDRPAHRVSDFLERSGGIVLVVAAGAVAAGFATIMRLLLPS